MKFAGAKMSSVFQDKKRIIIAVTCYVWIFTKLFSYNLWHSDRLFPLVPPFDFLENVPNFIHLGLFWSVLLGLSLISIFQDNNYFIAITLFLEFSSCMLDQNRWQPYEYQFFLTILFSLCYRNNQKQFLNYFTFLIIAVYINSGIHKFSGGFLYGVWENMILHQFFGFDKILFKNFYIHYGGLIIGLIEFGTGFGLLFFKQKRTFAYVLVSMHFFILLVLMPTGINHNSIVWPWNVVMIMYLLILFCTEKRQSIYWLDLIRGYSLIPFIGIGLLPFLNFFGWYDSFLSFNVYSGTDVRLEICIENPKQAEDYKEFFSGNSRFCTSATTIHINKWSLKELNIVAYPEKRIMLSIIKKFKERNPDIEAHFFIYQYPFRPENCRQYD